MRSSTKKEKEIKRLTQNNRVKTNEKRQKTMISSKKKTKAYKSWHKKSKSETNKSHINKAKDKNINNDLNKYIQY